MHTPGPWRITGPNIRAGNALLAVVENHWADMPCPEDEKAANARLIAAAPDLLDALRRVMRHIPADSGGASLSDDMHRASKAIAAATKD